MSYSDGNYQTKLGELQQGLLTFLQSFESEQEDIGFESVCASQQRLKNNVGEFFAITSKTFFSQIADAGRHEFHIFWPERRLILAMRMRLLFMPEARPLITLSCKVAFTFVKDWSVYISYGWSYLYSKPVGHRGSLRVKK
ncbi:MAG: hypothetical protein AB9Q18_07285 [Candidatus Reddybacter sp.]